MKKYFVGSEDKKIIFKAEDSEFYGINVTIKTRYIIIVLLLTISAVIGRYCIHAKEIQEVINTYTNSFPMDRNGFIFCDSSERVLSEAEVLKFKDNQKMEFRKILRSAINEIYARHGYIFGKNTENEKHYQKFQWYKDTQKHSVCWDEFNDTEKKNLRLLISIEIRYGYRTQS